MFGFVGFPPKTVGVCVCYCVHLLQKTFPIGFEASVQVMSLLGSLSSACALQSSAAEQEVISRANWLMLRILVYAVHVLLWPGCSIRGAARGHLLVAFHAKGIQF